jgi:hypothetical protein
VGNNVWNRVSFKLKKKRMRNDPAIWVRKEGAFPPIVDRPLFDAAQAIIQARSLRISDEAMIEVLRQLYEACGMLSGLVIDETDGMPSSSTYRARFGSLLRAYAMVGYRPRRDYRYIEINRSLRRLYPEIVSLVVNGLTEAGGVVRSDSETDLLVVNEEFSVSVIVARCRRLPSGALRWSLRFDTGLKADITVAVRMDTPNRGPFDFYLFPSLDVVSHRVRLAEDNGLALDAYRFDSLDVLFALAARSPLPEAA